MAYCANCGVELAASEKNCPLCGYVPDKKLCSNDESDAIYPTRKIIDPKKVSRKSIIAIITAVLLLPFCIVLLCDLSINCQMTWSGYAVWAICAVWLTAVIPVASKKKRPVLCLAAGFGSVLAYLFYISVKTGGNWALNFALPLTVAVFAVAAMPIYISRYVRLNGLSLSGIILTLLGLLCIVVELLANNAFSLYNGLRWSLYPAVSCLIVSALLWIINGSEPLKERLHKKFFM